MTNTFNRNDGTFAQVSAADLTGSYVSSLGTLTGTVGVGNGLTTSGGNLVLSAIAFSVHKNGTNQSGVSSGGYTQVTWSTEIYDIGSYFTSSTWTPPAGKVAMTAHCNVTGTMTDAAVNALSIQKNGSNFKQGITYASGTASVGLGVSAEDVANGTDAYTVAVFPTTSSGTATVDGAITNTFFMGHWIGS